MRRYPSFAAWGERRLHEGEGHSGVGGLAPAEAEPFPQHAHDLGDVAVRIRVGGATPDDDEHRLVERDAITGRFEGLADPVAGRAQELVVDAELARVADLHFRMLRFGKC